MSSHRFVVIKFQRHKNVKCVLPFVTISVKNRETINSVSFFILWSSARVLYWSVKTVSTKPKFKSVSEVLQQMNAAHRLCWLFCERNEHCIGKKKKVLIGFVNKSETSKGQLLLQLRLSWRCLVFLLLYYVRILIIEYFFASSVKRVPPLCWILLCFYP